MDYIGIAQLIKTVAIVALAGGGLYVGYRIVLVTKKISRTAQQVGNLVNAVSTQQESLANTAKSVKGMTSIYLPQIQEDFPDFNWVQFKQKCETTLKAYLLALDEQNVDKLKDASRELREQTRVQIENMKNAGIQEHFTQIKIHQTEIARYLKRDGMCVIQVQSAVEYFHTKGTQVAKLKEQTRYNSELVYVQDVSKLSEYATAVGANCPNCGAPITKLGNKFCEYCGTSVKPVDERVWLLHRIEEE